MLNSPNYLKHSIIIPMKNLGCNYHNHLYVSTTHDPLPYSHCCPYLSLDINTNRWCISFRDPNIVSLTARLHTSPDCSRRLTTLSKFRLKVASVEVHPICVKEDTSEENFDGVSIGRNSPPWGTLAVEQCSDFQTVGASKTLVVSKGKPSLNESRLQFLEERDEEVLSKRILKLSRSNKIRSALDLYRSMEFSGLKPNLHACNSLLSCLLRAKRVDDALAIFESMKANRMTTGHTYSLILKGIANGRGYEAAIDMFEELVGNSDLKKGFDAIAYNTMITVAAKENDCFQIERIWVSMKDNSLVGNLVTYRLLVCSFVRCGQNDLALDAYYEMVQNGLKPADDAMQAIIGACVKEGKWDLALNVFHDMLNRGMKPNIATCNTLVNSLGRAGKVNLALKIYGLMESLGHDPDAYTWNALMGALRRANRDVDALGFFKSIHEAKPTKLNIHVYNSALMSCKKLGLWDRALQLLWQMEASGLIISSVSYNLVIGACEVSRKPKAAFQVYEHMVHNNNPTDTFTRLSLLRCCIWGSLWNEVDQILDDSPDGSFYNSAIQGLCLRGKIDSARKHYEKMREIGLKPDGKTRALMLQNLSERPKQLETRARSFINHIQSCSNF